MTLDRFSTLRLRAERLTALHWPDLRRMDQDPAFMEFLGGVRDEVATAAYLEHNLAHWDEYGFGLWMLRKRESGEVVGRAVLRHLMVEGTDEVETGYGFLPRAWGCGLATEIARACVEIGRERLGLSSIVAIALMSNTASQQVMGKASLKYERDIVHGGRPYVLFRTGCLQHQEGTCNGSVE